MIRTAIVWGACIALDLIQSTWYQRERRKMGLDDLEVRLDTAHERANAELDAIELAKAARVRFPPRAA
jgi:hypothetical protein